MSDNWVGDICDPDALPDENENDITLLAVTNAICEEAGRLIATARELEIIALLNGTK